MPAAFAEQYGVSASFIHKWHKIIETRHELFQRDQHGFTLKLISKSVTDHQKNVVSPVQNSTTDTVVARRRSHLFEGSKRIKEALGLDCSAMVIDHVLRDRRLTRRRPKRKKPFYSRYESDRELDIIQMDYKQWNDKTLSIFTVNDRSRAILGIEVTNPATTDVEIALVNGEISRFGKPTRILTNHGCQFTYYKDESTSRFDIFCEDVASST